MPNWDDFGLSDRVLNIYTSKFEMYHAPTHSLVGTAN